ncbi:aminopeptidase N [Desulfuromonas acetoxidans]|uniref:aminopeptidase N n=1 Tax=Desulfuromonas acetoxidans TaxID=891 RepID=UPI00292F2D17|nr:aminopeptidase N [Desulfuromonas acetoxidans]
MADKPQPTYLKDYVPYPFEVERLDLEFDLEPHHTRVLSRARYKRKEHVDVEEPLRLNGAGQTLLSLSLDGTPLTALDYRCQDSGLVLPNVPNAFELTVVTEIDPEANKALEGLYLSSGNFCTQCEAQGFRRITYFPDRPDVMTRYTTTIRADKQRFPVLLSNGNLVEQCDLDDGRHLTRWEDPFFKPSYLFALVAGDLVCQEDAFTTMSGREVLLQIYVEARNADKCDHAMLSLKKAMAWDEQRFGFEYDLDRFMIVAVDDFNMGAMENKGLNVFNSKYVLARPETATDDDFLNIESVVGHEYFHNWTGNRITCRDWFQLSLKEGLTVFRDQEFSADMNSAAVKRIEEVRILQSHQFAEDSGPMAHPVRPESYVEINNFYTMTVYSKGAELIRMMQTLLGRDGFMAGIRLYVQRHDGQAVTTDDFVAAMEDASGVDLDQFRRWYSQAGTPVIHVEQHYDGERQQLTLDVTQSCPATPGQPDKQPFHIPLRLALLGPDGTPQPLHLVNESAQQGAEELVLSVTAARQKFCFEQVGEGCVVSLLRDFSAPVKLTMNTSRDELAFLMAHDNDAFNRWNASQRLAGGLLLDLVDRVRKGQKLILEPMFVEAFRTSLLDEQTDPSLLALALALPLESFLAEQMEEIDPQAIFTVREFVRHEVAVQLKDDFLTVYRRCADSGPYEVTPQAVGQRRLKNLCLGYLAALAPQDNMIWQMILEQFSTGRNMTDVSAALGLLADHDNRDSRHALDTFYATWKEDPLVVEKWLGIQARSRREDCLEQVERLMGTPAFNLHNPNKVRSLIGVFCQGNSVRFHAADGSGYDFLRRQVALIDPFNPQIAARLVAPLLRWPRYDDTRSALMKQALEQLQAKTTLSADLYEMVSKGLDQNKKG